MTEGRRWTTPLRFGRSDAAAFGFLCAVATLYTWPLMANLTTKVPDNLADPLHLSWVMSWQAHALLTRPWEMFDAPTFYPFRNGLALSEQMLGGAVLALPAWIFTHNPVFVFNLVLFVTFPIAGFGAYLLAREITGSKLAGLVAGCVFAFSPYRLWKVPHIHVELAMWAPYAILFLRRFLAGRSWWSAASLAAVLWLQLISSLHGILMLAATLPIVLVILVARDLSVVRRREFWIRGAVAGSGLALLALPFVLPYLRIYSDHPEFKRGSDEVALYSGGPTALLTAPPNNRLYGGKVNLLRRTEYSHEKTLFPGIAVLVVAGSGALWAVRERKRYELFTWAIAFTALGSFSAAMSTGTDDNLSGLFGFAQRHVPTFDAIRGPGRFATLTALALAGLCAIAASALADLGGPGRRWRAPAASAGVLLVLLAEATPAQMRMIRPYRIPAVYGWLARQPADRPVLELPTGQPYSRTEVDSATFVREARYLYFQTQHWRPILNGYSSSQPPTYIRMVMAVQDFPDRRSVRYLRRIGVRHVIVHRDWVRGTPWDDVESKVRTGSPEAIVLDDPKEFVIDLARLSV